ncbi:hypothetical protein LY76DRAFT_237811 [Colletotrichum caudatum]|nr:hypothetical protein LY76DRAFT_237811 [Colletotrichum caudatum]
MSLLPPQASSSGAAMPATVLHQGNQHHSGGSYIILAQWPPLRLKPRFRLYDPEHWATQDRSAPDVRNTRASIAPEYRPSYRNHVYAVRIVRTTRQNIRNHVGTASQTFTTYVAFSPDKANSPLSISINVGWLHNSRPGEVASESTVCSRCTYCSSGVTCFTFF